MTRRDDADFACVRFLCPLLGSWRRCWSSRAHINTSDKWDKVVNYKRSTNPYVLKDNGKASGN